MSYSSLYGIRENYTGERLVEYKNSWYFSPIIWDVLCDKYIPRLIQTPYGYKKSFITSGNELLNPLNNKVNNCESTPDRICWEMSMMQIFFTKDKLVISSAIRQFVKDNKRYDIREDKKGILEYEHIIERFNQIADDIESLDKNTYPYFVFKNTSCDDDVEYWFSKYNEETDEEEEKALNELDEYVAEFVVIEDGKISKFIPNKEFKY